MVSMIMSITGCDHERCFVSAMETLKLLNQAKFRHIWFRVKIKGGVGEMSEWERSLFENAGVENAEVATMQGWKSREWKTRHQTARVENGGVTSMESQKFPLFNIVTSGLQQPIELMWNRRTLRIGIFLLYN